VRERRPPCTLLIGEDAFAHSGDFIDGLRRAYDLRIVQCAPGAFTRRRTVVARELVLLARLLLSPHMYRSRNFIVCSSGPYAALAVSRIFGAFGRRRDVFLYNFYLHHLGRNALVRRTLAFLFTERTVVAAQSQVDLDYFRSLSDSVGLVLVPYGQGPVVGVTDADVLLGDYVFAGGYTNRDYDRLLRCARSLPTVPFVIACSSLNSLTESVPANVEVQRDLGPARFHELLAGARLVVIPLAEDVGASGQMVTLAAMQLGKALIVANSAVVTQYVEDGATGLVYERTSDVSLCDAVAAAVLDEDRLVELGSAARARYGEHFTKPAYDRSLLEALEGAFTRSRP
jgi:glycosyltransferase involved in cell wall biosynthesis